MMMTVISARIIGWFIWGLVSGGFKRVMEGDKNEWFTLLISLMVVNLIIPMNF